MSIGARLFQVLKLRVKSVFQSSLGEALKFTELLFEHLIESREQSGNAQEDSGFDNSQVILQLLHIS